MICNECGAETKSAAKFCSSCGASVSGYLSEQPPQTDMRLYSSGASGPIANMPRAAAVPHPSQASRRCVMHAGDLADGACVLCGSFFCTACLLSTGGRTYCQICYARLNQRPVQAQPQPQNPQPYLYNPPPAYQYNQPPAYPQNQQQPYMVVVAEKNPGVAVLLSFLMPGAGQIYNGDVGKALLFFFGFWILVWVFLGWGFWIAAMIDAHQSAQKINLGRRI